MKKTTKNFEEFARKREWEQFHNLKNLAISINIETSELLEIFNGKKLKLKDLKKKINKNI